MKDLNLTKSQLSILFALEVKPCLTMSRLSKYIGSSKETDDPGSGSPGKGRSCGAVHG